MSMVFGPTDTGSYNLFHVEDGAFVLEGNLSLANLKKLNRELTKVIAKAEKQQAKLKAMR